MATTALGERRKNDPKGMRARILDDAFALFKSRGYNGTSVLDIAASCAVTGGALHHHFPTKKALGLAVIGEKVAAAVEETWLAPLRGAVDGPAAILVVFRAIADELDAQGAVMGCPVNNLTLELSYADPDFRTALRVIFDDWRAAMAGALDGTADAAATATLLVAAYSGAMAIAKVEQRGDALRLCADRLAPILSRDAA